MFENLNCAQYGKPINRDLAGRASVQPFRNLHEKKRHVKEEQRMQESLKTIR